MKRFFYGIFLLILILGSPMPAHAAGGIPVGGIHILKTDVTGKALEGAVFQLVKIAQPEELMDSQLEKRIEKIGDENHVVLVVPFWASRDMTGPKQTEVSTDSHGQADVYGLPYGTYYLVEIKAPEGYNKIVSPMRVSVHKYSHLTDQDDVKDDAGKVIDHTLHIINVRYPLPDTGNWGRIQLIAGGVGIVFSSAALIMLNRRRKGW